MEGNLPIREELCRIGEVKVSGRVAGSGGQAEPVPLSCPASEGCWSSGLSIPSAGQPGKGSGQPWMQFLDRSGHPARGITPYHGMGP